MTVRSKAEAGPASDPEAVPKPVCEASRTAAARKVFVEQSRKRGEVAAAGEDLVPGQLLQDEAEAETPEDTPRRVRFSLT